MNQDHFDIIIAGGGITGAGIFKELSLSGLRVCLIEKNDFGSGTSSKSSKLVHGGLRYLKQGNLMLTLESVHHRERLLNELPGLVQPMEFIMPLYENKSPGKFTLGAGLALYDIMAMKKRHKFISPKKLTKKIKYIKTDHLKGAYSFLDASTDDSVLVFRMISEALKNKNMSCKNYNEIISVSNHPESKIITTKDEQGNISEYKTKIFINATGAWSEKIHKLPQKNKYIRPLKGSHLILQKEKLPINSAVSFSHPEDKRPVFAIPWEGAVLVGTTDLDADSMEDIKISNSEVKYLMQAINTYFPKQKIKHEDIISTFSGIRPVISSGDKDPSKESREHLVWENKGIISVTGGKLTTFRKLAWDTLEKAQKYFPGQKLFRKKDFLINKKTDFKTYPEKRIWGRYGITDLSWHEKNSLLKLIPETDTYLAEIEIASRDYSIKHLDDLLLRRMSIGMILKNGAMNIIEQIKELSSKNLKWDEEKWAFEIKRYKKIYKEFYSPKNT